MLWRNYFRKNKKKIPSFLNTERVKVVKILPCGKQGPLYLAYQSPWLLMTWRHKEPGHQQPWRWPNFPRKIPASVPKGLNTECASSTIPFVYPFHFFLHRIVLAVYAVQVLHYWWSTQETVTISGMILGLRPANDWLGANLESALLFHPSVSYDTKNTRNTTKMLISPMTTRLWRDMCLSDIWHTFPQTCGLMIHISSTSHEIWTSFCCALCCALLWLCYVFLVDFCLPISLNSRAPGGCDSNFRKCNFQLELITQNNRLVTYCEIALR